MISSYIKNNGSCLRQDRWRSWALAGVLVALSGCAESAPKPVAKAADPPPLAAMDVAPAPPRPQPVAVRLDPDLVSDVQGELMRLDYLDSAPDGELGRKTKSAIKRFQREHGMRADGKISKSLLDRLQSTSSGAATASRGGRLEPSGRLVSD